MIKSPTKNKHISINDVMFTISNAVEPDFKLCKKINSKAVLRKIQTQGKNNTAIHFLGVGFAGCFMVR